MTADRTICTRAPAIAIALGWVAIIIIGLAGVMKLINLPHFAESLSTWTVVPRATRPVVAVAVPVFECAIAGSWFAIPAIRRGLLRLAAACVVTFSVLYVIQLMTSEKPTCACFGELSRFLRMRDNATLSLVQNAVILGCLLAACFARRVQHGSRVQTCGEVFGKRGQHNRPGVSLIECVLCVAIIGLLATLLAPSLGGVRDGARSRMNESNLRQHATVVTSYTGDYAGMYPMLVYADATSSVVRCESADVAIEMPYFVISRYWNVGLADAYYAGDYRAKSFVTPFSRSSIAMTTEYELPCVFLADPRFFDGTTRTSGLRQLRPTRADEVMFPSAKALLIAKRPWTENVESVGDLSRRGRHAIATADGRSATFDRAALLVDEYREPVFEETVWISDHFMFDLPLRHSRSGVRARDLR